STERHHTSFIPPGERGEESRILLCGKKDLLSAQHTKVTGGWVTRNACGWSDSTPPCGVSANARQRRDSTLLRIRGATRAERLSLIDERRENRVAPVQTAPLPSPSV